MHFFPHIVTILDTKEDEKVNELSIYHDLSKLIILREMDIITDQKFEQLKQSLIDLQKQFMYDAKPLAYRMELKKKGIHQYIKMFNQPDFSTYTKDNPDAFYTGVANRLIDVIEIQKKKTIDFNMLLEQIHLDYDENEKLKVLSKLDKILIEDIIISEKCSNYKYCIWLHPNVTRGRIGHS